jgi:hypothetical protein
MIDNEIINRSLPVTQVCLYLLYLLLEIYFLLVY